jgi:hypothetical protein
MQRVKLKQYEFAIQETMLYLAKPLNKYVDWINSNSTQDLEFDWPLQLSGKHYTYTDAVEKPKLGRHAQLDPKPSTPTQPTRPSPVSPTTKNPSGKDLSPLEITAIECMRIGFNFLHNCQKYIKAIDDGTYKIPAPTGSSPVEDAPAVIVPPLGTEKVDEATEIPKKKHVEYPSIAISAMNTVDVTDGDLAAEQGNEITQSPAKKCQRCHRAFLLVDQLKDQLAASESLCNEMKGRLEKEIQARKIVQKAKEMMDQEIEEITAELFSRANQMVVDEAWKMDQLQTTNRELTKQVSDLKSRCKEKENELAQVTKCLYDLQASNMLHANYSTQKKEQKSDCEPKERKAEFSHSIISGFDQFHSVIAGDGFIFQEFQDFMRIVVVSANQVSTQAYQSIHSSVFMKRMMIESVEPCLYYTYQPNSSFKALGTGLSQSFKKKLLDYCIRGQIHIAPKDAEPTTPSMKEKCMVCTVARECEYRVSMGPLDGPKPESSPCCRFCRDRVLATQDFFLFVTYLATGKHSATILSLFKQILWLKRRMALAVVGSCSLFETELTAILGPGGGGDWEKETEIVY